MAKEDVGHGYNGIFCALLFSLMWSVACQFSLCPRNFPGKNTGAGCHFLHQVMFPTQGPNPSLLCLLHWQVDSLSLCHIGRPVEYYSITKRNEIVSGEMWMDLGSVILCELKEKKQMLYINTYMYV